MKTVARKRPKTYNQCAVFFLLNFLAAFSHALAEMGAAVKEGRRWAWQQGRGTGVQNDPIAGEKFRL